MKEQKSAFELIFWREFAWHFASETEGGNEQTGPHVDPGVLVCLAASYSWFVGKRCQTHTDRAAWLWIADVQPRSEHPFWFRVLSVKPFFTRRVAHTRWSVASRCMLSRYALADNISWTKLNVQYVRFLIQPLFVLYNDFIRPFAFITW